MKKLWLSLGDRPLGTVRIDHVRGRETWTFAFDDGFLGPENPMLDPAVANVRGPQYGSWKVRDDQGNEVPTCRTPFGECVFDTEEFVDYTLEPIGK